MRRRESRGFVMPLILPELVVGLQVARWEIAAWMAAVADSEAPPAGNIRGEADGAPAAVVETWSRVPEAATR
jgi:hypothetical protein